MSFVDMSSKAHHQLDQAKPDNTEYTTFLLEPSQESLLAAASGSRLRSLLTDFFDATLQACAACTSLLASAARARSHLRRLLALLSSPLPSSDLLSSHLDAANPLSPHSLAHFHRTHARYAPLVRRLTAAHRRILRRVRLLRAVGWAPGYWEAAGARVDAAARGAYIIERDMDTMSRLVRRVHDEVEHGRDVARMVVRYRERQLVREVEDGVAGLEAQLAELEDHVFLCLTTINRSRRLVAQELMGDSSSLA